MESGDKLWNIRYFSLPKSKSLSRLKLRRLNEDEKPLLLAILWMKNSDNNTKFVMQENDPGEIQWEQFSLPELKNFLLILDREEAWYKRRWIDCQKLKRPRKDVSITLSFDYFFCVGFMKNMKLCSKQFMNYLKIKDQRKKKRN